jgi:hypothetical protein
MQNDVRRRDHFFKERCAVASDVQSADVDTAMHGDRIDESVYDATVKVTVEGWGDWSSLAVILPTSTRTPVIGSRIMTDADVPLVCAGTMGTVRARKS